MKVTKDTDYAKYVELTGSHCRMWMFIGALKTALRVVEGSSDEPKVTTGKAAVGINHEHVRGLKIDYYDAGFDADEYHIMAVVGPMKDGKFFISQCIYADAGACGDVGVVLSKEELIKLVAQAEEICA